MPKDPQFGPIEESPSRAYRKGKPPPDVSEVEPLTHLPGTPDPAVAAHEAEMLALGMEELIPDDFVPASRAARLRALAAESARRRMEALNLYEPLKSQAPFHKSKTRLRVVRGSNRAGKTLCSAVEVAGAVTGRDPHGKYPRTDGRCFCVGKDLKHVGQVMYRKLFRAGAFKIIRDGRTKQWRAFRPWDPKDRDREDQAKPAPPLIPPRLVKSIAWENKKEGIPSTIVLHNGWEMCFFSSLGKPPQGSDIDLWWFDEEIVDPEWFPEMSARILDRRGKGLWSATPQAGTEQLFELHERAADERGRANKSVEEFAVFLADNPHVREEDKRALAADLSDDEARVRIGGEFAIQSFKIYPQFSMLVHGVDWFDPPRSWTHYLVVDPGHQVCAVLFAAVPPAAAAPAAAGDPRCGSYVYLFDELYLKECDADKFGEAVAQKVAGRQFEAFLIDPHMGIHTELGTGRTVAEQYGEALRVRQVRSHTTGHSFRLASDDVQAGILAVHGWLRVRQDGTTKLRVLRGALPNLEWEIKRYHKKRVGGQVVDAPDQRKHNHLMDGLRYLALADPRYIAPRKGQQPEGSGALTAFKQKQAKRRQQFGPSFINFGPRSGYASGA